MKRVCQKEPREQREQHKVKQMDFQSQKKRKGLYGKFNYFLEPNPHFEETDWN